MDDETLELLLKGLVLGGTVGGAAAYTLSPKDKNKKQPKKGPVSLPLAALTGLLHPAGPIIHGSIADKRNNSGLINAVARATAKHSGKPEPTKLPSAMNRLWGGSILGTIGGGAAGLGLGSLIDTEIDGIPSELAGLLTGFVGGSMTGGALGANSYNKAMGFNKKSAFIAGFTKAAEKKGLAPKQAESYARFLHTMDLPNEQKEYLDSYLKSYIDAKSAYIANRRKDAPNSQTFLGNTRNIVQDTVDEMHYKFPKNKDAVWEGESTLTLEDPSWWRQVFLRQKPVNAQIILQSILEQQDPKTGQAPMNAYAVTNNGEVPKWFRKKLEYVDLFGHRPAYIK